MADVELTEVLTYRRLVTAGNSKIEYEDLDVAAGTMTELDTTGNAIVTTDQLSMFEAFQKAIVVNGTNLKIVDFINTKITIAALTTAPTRGSVVTQAESTATMVVDFVNTGMTEIYGYTTSGTFVTTAGNTLSGGGMTSANSLVPTAVVEATTAPHWYDYTVYPGGASGSMPAQAYLGCLYRGRVVLSGNPTYPHQWYMSRQSNIFDYLYATGDAQSPVAGGNSDAGEIGDIVRCLIPYRDDYLLFGCANSIWVLRGDPAAGGSLDEVDLTVGMYGAHSWCYDGDGNLFFWGSHGIYKMDKNFGGIENISRISLPAIVSDEAPDPSTHRITMVYDRNRYGIVICITKLADGSNSNYFLSLLQPTYGLFPETYPDECGVYSSIYYDTNDKTLQGVVLGCKDGYIRTFDDTATNDAGSVATKIEAYVLYPILHLSEEEDREGKLTSLTIVLGGGAADSAHSDTNGVSYDIHVADDPESLVEAVKNGDTPFATGTLTGPGRKDRIRTRVRGAWLGIKMYNDTISETFAINKISGKIIPAGRIT